MALLCRWALPWMLLVRRQVGAPTVSLVLGVMVCWFVIFGVVALAVPTPEIVSTPVTLAFAPGDRAHIHRATRGLWLIPIERATYDEDLPPPSLTIGKS